MSQPQIRVLCIDDNEALLRALEVKISLEPGMACVGALSTADQLIDEAKRQRADVVLLDLEMPGRDSMQALAELSRECPGTRTIILSAFLRDEYIEAALAAGAWGYLSKGDT